MLRLTLICLLSLCIPCIAQTSRPTAKPASSGPTLREDAPEEVRAFWKAFEERRDQQISKLQSDTSALRDKLKKTSVAQDRVKIQLVIRYNEDQLQRLSSPDYYPDVPRLKDFDEGNYGTIEAEGRGSAFARINQVIDEHNALVTWECSEMGGVHVGKDGTPQPYKGIEYKYGPMWVVADTKNWSDGSGLPASYSRSTIWMVTGTHKYVTTEGATRTVPLLKPILLSQYLDRPKTSEKSSLKNTPSQK